LISKETKDAKHEYMNIAPTHNYQVCYASLEIAQTLTWKTTYRTTK
jgi:hypothetical protein